MGALETLLIQHGYAPLAAKLFAQQPIAPQYSTENDIEARLNILAGNYYMQCLAAYLEGYGFNLNRYDIASHELHYADLLIHGHLGNAPLDNPQALRLLELCVIALRKRHERQPITWEDVFAYEYAAPNGALVRGADMLKALIKSNAMHNGKDVVHYAHTFGQMVYRTYTMHEAMEQCLRECATAPRAGLTRFGQVVQFLAVNQIKLLPRAVKHLSKLTFFNVFHMNIHRRLCAVITDILRVIDDPEVDFLTLQNLQAELRIVNPYPSMYPDDWKRFIDHIDIWLESVTTPYAEVQAAR